MLHALKVLYPYSQKFSYIILLTFSIAVAISSIATAPPHILYTYSAVINSGSKEQERPSHSINDCSLSFNNVSVIFINRKQ